MAGYTSGISGFTEGGAKQRTEIGIEEKEIERTVR
jgi:hypothetical protein